MGRIRGVKTRPRIARTASARTSRWGWSIDLPDVGSAGTGSYLLLRGRSGLRGEAAAPPFFQTSFVYRKGDSGLGAGDFRELFEDARGGAGAGRARRRWHRTPATASRRAGRPPPDLGFPGPSHISGHTLPLTLIAWPHPLIQQVVLCGTMTGKWARDGTEGHSPTWRIRPRGVPQTARGRFDPHRLMGSGRQPRVDRRPTLPAESSSTRC